MDLNVDMIIQSIIQGDENGVQTQLQEFNKEYAQCFFFDAEETDRRKNLAAVLVRFIRTGGVRCHLLRVCLRTLRILSRDERALGPLVTDSALLTLAKLAGLTVTDPAEDAGDLDSEFCDDIASSLAEARASVLQECSALGEDAKRDISNGNSGDPDSSSGYGSHPGGIHHKVLERGRRDRRESQADGEEEEEGELGEEAQRKEALKVLCNVVYNSTWAQERFSALRLLRGLTERLSRGAACPSLSSGQFYELRLMFLITALLPELGLQLQQEGGLSILTASLESCLEVQWKDQYEVLLDPAAPPISPEASQRSVEILKILFNISYSAHRQEPNEDAADLYRHLVAVLRLCLMRRCELVEDTDELQGHTVNLLSALPLQCLDVLLSASPDPDTQQWRGVNMDCVHTLLLFMERRLDSGDKMKEKLTPVLNLLTECCRAHRETRQYIRKHVLPPLRDVSLRPEEGSTVRSRLIRLMTHLDTNLKHCAADLIFVLCKENVGRFVKYTGYGNAAGLLAARGLLGGLGLKSSSPGAQYSSDSDSDTEEYRRVKGCINPVTGRVEAEQPDPMEGMTEEEKEAEAQKLIALFNKLSRGNVIQPMGMDAEGRLVPMTGLRDTSPAEEEQSEARSDGAGDEGERD